MKSLVIVGGAGRMGQALAEGLSARGYELVALVDVHEPRDLFGAPYVSSLDALGEGSVDVVIDFSSPEGVASSAKWCADHGIALVVADTAGRWPLLEDLTADFVYLRLHGDKELYASGYDDAALDRWAARMDRAARS